MTHLVSLVHQVTIIQQVFVNHAPKDVCNVLETINVMPVRLAVILMDSLVLLALQVVKDVLIPTPASDVPMGIM